MSTTTRVGVAGVLAEAQGRAGTASNADAAASYLVEGEVLEVLGSYGVAHVRAPDGSTFGVNRETPGICFARLHAGQRVRVEVAHKFNRVLHAQLIG